MLSVPPCMLFPRIMGEQFGVLLQHFEGLELELLIFQSRNLSIMYLIIISHSIIHPRNQHSPLTPTGPAQASFVVTSAPPQAGTVKVRFVVS
jgi:hypothetical protein